MTKSIRAAILLVGVTMSMVTAASAQMAPQSTVPQNPPLIDQAQQNIGTAQILFKLGQTQGQLAAAQDKEAARDKQEAELATYWKGYVDGIDHMVEAGIVRQPTGELQALPESERHKLPAPQPSSTSIH